MTDNLDLTWMLVAASMVMMMQVGFMLLEAGMVRSKNSINVAQKNLLDFVFGMIVFAWVGFMFAFGRSDGFWLGVEPGFYFLRHLDDWQAGFFVFQVMFCGTAATIVSGAVAERMRLVAYVFGAMVIAGFIYPVFVHWAWGAALWPNDTAFLANLGFVDFAGSTVVHSTGGWVALAACVVIGARHGRFGRDGKPVRIAGHNPVLSTTGCLLLFFGWIGFNGGSTLKATADVAPIIMNTILAGAMGTCIGYVMGHYRDGVILPEKSISGMLGGLVAVTAGCHILEPAGALLIGAFGGAAAIYGNSFLEERLKIDDAVGAIGVHAFAGVVGTLGLALLAPVDTLPAGGRLSQLYIQIFGAGLNFYWAFGTGFAFFWLCDRLIGIRVQPQEEEDGLNVAEHGTRLGVGHVEQALAGLVNGTADIEQRLPVVNGDESERLTGLFNRLMDNIEVQERNRGQLLEIRRDHEEAERVAALANATFEAIVIHRFGTIVDGNEQLTKLTRMPLSELMGRSLFEFVADEDKQRVADIMHSDNDTGFEITVVLKDGERIPVAARGREILYRGEPARVSCLVDLRERREAEQRIRYLALHDPLTGLPNRALFSERLAELVERAAHGGNCAVVLVDLDHFKDVNDIHGHQAGDAVIRETARRLTSLAGPQDVVARLGGDEFAVILGNASFEAQLEDFGLRLVREMAAAFDTGFGDKVNVGVSVGAALCPEHADDMEALIGCADVALYHAKNSGRNTYRVFRRGMNELIEKRRALEADIDAALERGEFELYLQPRICAKTAAVTGYEALIRWQHPKRGFIPPADFIPVAEASGKIVQLGEWVIAEACRLLRQTPGAPISVNVSPVQFRHSEFLTNLADIVRHSGVSPERMELEITESVLIDDDARAHQILDELKTMGFGIALDDFGTGYSSLGYLSRYPFDTIKIDRSFVSNLTVADNATLIVKTIIDLGAGLGMKVVAEGVETLDEATFLVEAGCDELQGYLLGRPMPPSGVVRYIDGALAEHLRSLGAHCDMALINVSKDTDSRIRAGKMRGSVAV